MIQAASVEPHAHAFRGAAPRDDVPPQLNGAEESQDDQTWMESLRFTGGKTKKITREAGNAALLLSHLVEWKDVLAFNEFKLSVVFHRAPPEIPGLQVPQLGEVFGDQHVIFVQHWLSKVWDLPLGKDKVLEAVAAAARRRSFHPVRTYLDALVWDGTPRIDRWLPSYLGAADNPYTRAVGAKWLISAVARVRSPGAKVDTMLILEGIQGRNKSQALEVLGGTYYSDTTLDLRSKDSMLNLLGIWIYEWGELDGLMKYETTRVKSFLSSKVDHFRAPYDRLPAEHPRQCVFAGTVNPSGEGYLRDETGNRRFWPVQVDRGDLAALARDRDQLWAEADARFDAGEAWWLDQDQADLAEQEQEERYTGDPWEEVLARHLRGRLERVFADELFRELSIPIEERTRSNLTRVGVIMSHLRWTRGRETVGERRRFYVPPRPRPTSDGPLSNVGDGRLDDEMR